MIASYADKLKSESLKPKSILVEHWLQVMLIKNIFLTWKLHYIKYVFENSMVPEKLYSQKILDKTETIKMERIKQKI